MTVDTHMCLSIVLLVNKFQYRLKEIKKTMYVVKPSFIVQDRLLCHEKSYFLCSREITLT